MKKLVLSLGLLGCTGNIVYGMNAIRTAIEQRNWQKVVTTLKNYPDDQIMVETEIEPTPMTNFEVLCSTDTAILNEVSPSGSSLLLTLISHSGDACEQALVTLIKQKKLSLLAQDAGGRLLCQKLTDNNKKKLLRIIAQHEIDNPFTYTVRDNPSPSTAILTGNITLNPKGPNDYAWISADNKIRLSIVLIVLTSVAVAASTLYKWHKKKTATDDDNDEEADKDDEHKEEIAYQVTV